MNHDLGRVRRVFHREELLDRLVLLLAGLVRVNCNHPPLVPAAEEVLRLDAFLKVVGVGRILGDH